MRLALRIAFITSVIALAAVSSMLIPLDGSITRVTRVGAADPIDVSLSGGGGTGVFSFGTNCNTAMAPGDVCQDLVTVRNVGAAGALSFTYTIWMWLDADGIDSGDPGPAGDVLANCFAINFQHGAADGLNVGTGKSFGPLNGSQLGLGQSETWGLEAAVDDDNACMGQTAVIMGLVVATSVDNTPAPTSTPITVVIETPQPTSPVATATPIRQVQAATAVVSPTRTSQTQGIVVQELPRTGQGSARHGTSPWVIAAGALLALLASVLLAANLALEVRSRR